MRSLTRTGLAFAAVLAITAAGALVQSSVPGAAGASAPQPQQALSAPAAVAAPADPAAPGAVPRADQPRAEVSPALAASLTPTPENLYVPLAPCRIADTRTGSGTNGTPFTSGTTRTFFVGGTTGFAPQGGKSGGCSIPTDAVAVAAVVTAVSPSGPGFVRTWPVGGTEPGSTLLSYPRTGAGTGGTVTIAPTSGKALTVKNYGATTDIILDVQGYYVSQIHGTVSLGGTLTNGTRRVLSASRNATGNYQVTIDRTLDGCSASGSPDGSGPFTINVWTSSGNTVFVTTYNSAGAPTDINFRFTVTC